MGSQHLVDVLSISLPASHQHLPILINLGEYHQFHRALTLGKPLLHIFDQLLVAFRETDFHHKGVPYGASSMRIVVDALIRGLSHAGGFLCEEGQKLVRSIFRTLTPASPRSCSLEMNHCASHMSLYVRTMMWLTAVDGPNNALDSEEVEARLEGVAAMRIAEEFAQFGGGSCDR